MATCMSWPTTDFSQLCLSLLQKGQNGLEGHVGIGHATHLPLVLLAFLSEGTEWSRGTHVGVGHTTHLSPVPVCLSCRSEGIEGHV